MKVLNRARHLYSEEYIISDTIKFELNQMYLFHNKRWTECDEATRSINFSDMKDSEGTKIFASLSEDGKCGDILEYPDDYKSKGTARYKQSIIFASGVGCYINPSSFGKCKVTGIQQ